MQRQEERVSKPLITLLFGALWSLRKHMNKGLQQLAPRKGQQERYRDNNAGLL